MALMSAIEHLKQTLSKKEAELRDLTEDIEALRRAIAIISGNQGAAPGRAPPGLTAGDAAEQILRNASRSMHITKVVEELKGLGLQLTKEQVSTALRKDRRKRFRNLGRNTFELSENVKNKE